MASSELTDLHRLFDRLFPVCRSIAGPGIRESLAILSEHMDLEIHGIPTGTRVLDWTVPQEWTLRRARLFGPDGATVLDTEDSNLHVLNFSEPFSGEMELDALQAHLYSDPTQPDAVPYVTSYYVPRWGLCLSQRQRDGLQPGRYRVEIETEKADGVLNYGVAELPGQSDELFLITSYLCHPSMANNELSGPLALLRVWERLAAMESRRFTYRFLLIPETIGSISYLAQHGQELVDRMRGGLVLTCLGGPSPTVSFKTSRRDWTGEPAPIDRLARHLADAEPELYSVRDFTPTGGSDERQFCSPGFNLPVAQAARTLYGAYREYHTSLDTLDFMTIQAVEASADRVLSALLAHELFEARYLNKVPYGEPQLGRRGLYPTLNGPMSSQFSTDSEQDGRQTLDRMLCLLSLADGTRTLVEIAEHVGCSVRHLEPIALHLEREGLLEDLNR